MPPPGPQQTQQPQRPVGPGRRLQPAADSALQPAPAPLQEPALQEPALQEPALQEPALQEPALQEPALPRIQPLPDRWLAVFQKDLPIR